MAPQQACGKGVGRDLESHMNYFLGNYKNKFQSLVDTYRPCTLKSILLAGMHKGGSTIQMPVKPVLKVGLFQISFGS